MFLSDLNIFQSIALDKVLEGLQALNGLSLYGMEYEGNVNDENKYELAKLRYTMVGRKLSYVLIKLLYDTGLLKGTMPESVLKVEFDLPNPVTQEGIVLAKRSNYGIPRAEIIIDTLVDQFHGELSESFCYLASIDDLDELRYDMEVYLDEEDVNQELEYIMDRYGDTFLYVYMIQFGDLVLEREEVNRIGEYISPTPYVETTYYHKENLLFIYVLDMSEMAGGYDYSINAIDPFGFVFLLKQSITDPPKLCMYCDKVDGQYIP